MYGILVLCLGYLLHVWDISLMFWKNQNHMSPGCNYGGVYCLVYGILVLCLGYLSYVWDTSLMFGIFVLCMYLVPSTWYQVLGTKYFGISAAEGGEPPLGL